MTMSENPSRQLAMAIGCAVESRTSGPESETPTSANPRTTNARRSVVGWLMAEASTRDGYDDRHCTPQDLRQAGDHRDPVALRRTVALWHGQARKEQADELESVDVIITSYALLRRDEEMLKELDLSYAICSLGDAESPETALSRIETEARSSAVELAGGAV